jgi:5-methylcytosine-specific restriction endonuclease McrA
MAEVFERGLDALIEKLEKQKFAATDRPRSKTGKTTSKRHIPAHIKRAVWQRDSGRCTFMSDNGHRCHSRKFLEFDHVIPVARGGLPTTQNLRLRCRAHNQYEAERAFGVGFMSEKRHLGGTSETAT